MVDKSLDMEINMDKERGRTPKAGKKPDIHRFVVRRTKQVDFASLRNYLERKLVNMNDSVLEAISTFSAYKHQYVSH